MRPIVHLRSAAPCVLLLAALALSITACSDSTEPAATTGDHAAATLEGSLDPGGGTFVLKSLDDVTPDDDRPVPVELIGRALEVLPDSGEVRLEVALRNRWEQPLHAPAMVWLFDFTPTGVVVQNADVVEDGARYGLDYSRSVGDDLVLEPGETSEFKLWIFRMRAVGPFSFAARARFGAVPDLPRIAGRAFIDRDRNGVADPTEPPVPAGRVQVQGPGGARLTAYLDAEGRYAVPAERPGLYTLLLHPMIRDHGGRPDGQPIEFTTPNPLEVVLTPGPDGPPAGFDQADFGVFVAAPRDSVPQAILTPDPPGRLESDPWSLLRGEVHDMILDLAVGYSGCQPDHPFTLYMAGGFMESNPVQARLVLVHDDLDEPCDQWFQGHLRFDLRPIWRAYMEAYGNGGPVLLTLIDPNGEERRFELHGEGSRPRD